MYGGPLCDYSRSSDFTNYQALLGIVVDEHDDQLTGLWSGCGGTSQVDDSTATQEERAEPTTSSPVKTLAATVKLETPRAQTKAPTSNPPTTIPESPNPKKRAVANADLPESPKRHKKEQAKEGHADAPTHKDEQEGTGLVIQHGDEVDVQYVLSVQNQDGTYTIRREAITLTTVKIGDEAALFGV
ncbi:hypothetical protein PC9H_010220 [Pleurotus ostreatus]|uniref:Uncharacterized protein n=1 Tax=Pleurotus ostreatus TaxID=5322 RepID=A0A8H6ZR39_PLEOS|nr:uncharacterized protein PC9H_010220 [Pleurotus ostreatus]KAF7424909.1 hypothetical protein PC9H_010220 [Pleurotus ostreatus]